MLGGDENRCWADFVVGKGDGRGMAMDLHILRIGPVQANSVISAGDTVPCSMALGC